MEGAPAAGAKSRSGEGARLPAELYSHSAPGHLRRGAAHVTLSNRFLLNPACTWYYKCAPSTPSPACSYSVQLWMTLVMEVIFFLCVICVL